MKNVFHTSYYLRRYGARCATAHNRAHTPNI